jgi:anti-sigma-K factor RskA
MTLSPEDEGFAAEYALGTLDADERAVAEARRRTDADFDAAVAGWEARLGLLAEAAPERAPPNDLFPRIEARLDASNVVPLLARRLARWRTLALGGGALSGALAAALAFLTIARPTPPHQFVAILQKSADAPAFAMTVDVDKLEFSVRPVAAEAPAGKAYELWIIAPDSAPKSLGVIDATGRAESGRLAFDPAAVRAATYAVTVEPPGGSPNGKPSGAPVFLGKLIPVGP